MKVLYEAANAIEAHLLRDLLQHEGLSPFVQGELLQGAMGELPLAGLVFLWIPDEEYAQAREIVLDWEKADASARSSDDSGEDEEGSAARAQLPEKATRFYTGKAVSLFFIGLALGVAASATYFRAPVSSDGTDDNRDGVDDETWIYAPDGRLQKWREDRNFDGKVDATADYRRGRIEESSSDDNFDGFFDSTTRYRNGNAESETIDSNADGAPDIRNTFKHGVPLKSEILSGDTGLPLRVEFWKLGTLQYADIDSDRNGALDTRIFYSMLSEEVKRQTIPQAR